MSCGDISSPEPPPLRFEDDTTSVPPSFSAGASSGPIEDYFNSMPVDFLNNDDNTDDTTSFVEQFNELVDCSLSPEELKEFLTPPSCDQWKDFPSFDHPTFVTIDDSKEKQWLLAKQEIQHIRTQMPKLIGKENLQKKDFILFTLGPKSDVGEFKKKQFELSDVKYLEFISTICIQSAYRVTATEMFHTMSHLQKDVLLNEAEYNKIWRTFATKRELDGMTMSTNRREVPIWRTLEDLVNTLLRKISISGREGEISIALDDDKIWLAQTKSKMCDLFGLKYTTHVKPNRKGIIGHTGITTGLLFPLGIIFEQTFDTSLSCFKRLFNFLFQHDTE